MQELLEAGAAWAEQVLRGNAAVGEGQRPGVGRVPAHLPIRLAGLVARCAALDDQVRDLVIAGDRGDRDVARDLGAGVGDELLRAVDDPLVAGEAGAGLGVAGVRAGLGLGEPEGAELAPRAEIGQEPLLLVVGAEQVNRLGAERGVGAERDRDRRVDPGQLLDRERVGERVTAPAADALRERDPHQVELAHLRDQFVWEGLRTVEFGGDRGHLAPSEIANGVAQKALLV